MNLFGQQLLAGAGFTGDEHRRVGRRHALDLLQHLAERAIVADDARRTDVIAARAEARLCLR